jgi:hypothetical protein
VSGREGTNRCVNGTFCVPILQFRSKGQKISAQRCQLATQEQDVIDSPIASIGAKMCSGLRRQCLWKAQRGRWSPTHPRCLFAPPFSQPFADFQCCAAPYAFACCALLCCALRIRTRRWRPHVWAQSKSSAQRGGGCSTKGEMRRGTPVPSRWDGIVGKPKIYHSRQVKSSQVTHSIQSHSTF